MLPQQSVARDPNLCRVSGRLGLHGGYVKTGSIKKDRARIAQTRAKKRNFNLCPALTD
jgi:hypothetical protein